jgi:hypothetical protein
MVRNTTFSIFYPPINNIREQIFKLETELSEYFVKPFNLIPIPNEAPPEFPRMTATSNHGYTNLNISINSTQIITNYDSNFSNDWAKCESYILDRANRIYDLLSPFFANRILFCGLTTDLLIEVSNKNAVDKIKGSLFRLESDKPYDLLGKVTFVKDEKYYLNYLIQNQRFPNPIGIVGIPLKMLETDNFIELNIDVNDRYAFNYGNNYASSKEVFGEIIGITRKIVNEKIDKIINEGRFDI